MRHAQTQIKLDKLFQVKSGDYHSIEQLDPGKVPLVACGDTNNGVVGVFDIPIEKTYRRALTVAYNGSWPLLTKFHPYEFGAKDDVAILVPRQPMRDSTLFYAASLLNMLIWRYSYGRKCYREKLQNVSLSIPNRFINVDGQIDENAIANLIPKRLVDYIPERAKIGDIRIPTMQWKRFSILDILSLKRGDFHSIATLDPGPFVTVSRVTDNNGVVGFFDRPQKAKLYPRGSITISTVGGDAFVQLEDFIATDNVVVCTPKSKLRIATLFFVALMLNQQKWRYSYGRQCYMEKLGKVKINLPVNEKGELDEHAMHRTMEQTTYWHRIKERFGQI